MSEPVAIELLMFNGELPVAYVRKTDYDALAARLAEAERNTQEVAKAFQWERERRQEAEREIRYLRHYGNKDCTHMADEAMARGDMDEATADSASPRESSSNG